MLGNLEAKRDWGYAKDYVEAMWLMLQQKEPDDYVIATGEVYSVRDFATMAFGVAGIELKWRGEGVSEQAVDAATGEVRVVVDPKYYRPSEVDYLQGDASKAHRILGWQPRTSLPELVRLMVEYDLKHDGYSGEHG